MEPANDHEVLDKQLRDTHTHTQTYEHTRAHTYTRMHTLYAFINVHT